MLSKIINQIKYHLSNRNQISALMGTMLEHYDSSLYGFMAPFLAPLFFPNFDPVSGMILLFATYPVTYLAKPAGAYFIGRIGDKYGRKKALQLSMTGMGIATLCMGIVPTYNKIGVLAPILLVLIRMAQIFFVSGESNGGAIFMLEHSRKEYHGRTSGFYCAFTALGILFGALAASLVMKQNGIYWRIPYFFGIATTICAIYLRYRSKETPVFKRAEEVANHNIPYRKILNLIIISAFARILYMVPSVLVISFVPLATNIPISKIMEINNYILIIYVIVLPFFGVLTDKVGSARMLKFAIIAALILAYPSFCLFYYKKLPFIFAGKLIMILITACFYCAIHPWYLNQFIVRQRYKYVSLSYAIGAQIGASSPAISMAIYKKTGLISSYTMLIVVFGVLALITLLKSEKNKYNK